jgi:hypothetical protein
MSDADEQQVSEHDAQIIKQRKYDRGMVDEFGRQYQEPQIIERRQRQYGQADVDLMRQQDQALQAQQAQIQQSQQAQEHND